MTYEVVFFEDNYALNKKLLNGFCVYLYQMFMKGGNSDWLWSLLFLCMSKSVLSPRLIHYFGIPPL